MTSIRVDVEENIILGTNIVQLAITELKRALSNVI